MICPECGFLTFHGLCITIGCPNYQEFEEFWTVIGEEEEVPLEEDNHFA